MNTKPAPQHDKGAKSMRLYSPPTSTLAEVFQVADAFFQSGLFTDLKSAQQAVVKILAGRELGLGPFAAMNGIDIIKGRTSVSANILAGAIKRSGRYSYKVVRHTDSECLIHFFEDGVKSGESLFTMDDARRAGLVGKENWKKYPKNMLFARALSSGARWHCPDATAGPVYLEDELGGGTVEDVPTFEDAPAEVVEIDADTRPISDEKAQQLAILVENTLGLSKEERHTFASDVLGRPIKTFKRLPAFEARAIHEAMESTGIANATQP